MSFNINFVGHIPFNPDHLLDKRRFFNRPVGFNYLDFIKMYWTVKSFKVSIVILNSVMDDPFTTFMMGGGFTSTVFGATAGLNAVANSLNNRSLAIEGYTKIFHRYTRKVRKKRTTSIPYEGLKNGIDVINKDPSDFDIDDKIENSSLVVQDLKPNEGTICAPGPVHTMVKNGVYLEIDLSNIFYYQKKYWPIIKFLASTGDISYSTDPFLGNTDVISSIQIMGATLPLYADLPFSFARLPGGVIVANGKISPGDRCCDRFFWDGKDKEREKDSKCSKNCSDDISQGVYKKSKDKK